MIPTILYVFQLMIEAKSNPENLSLWGKARNAFDHDLSASEKPRVDKAVSDYIEDPSRLSEISRDLMA